MTAPQDRPDDTSGEASVGQLLAQLSEQTTRLVRDEIRLAQVEIKESVKHAGIGAGLFGGAGVVALFGAGTLVAAAVLALALVLPGWASALVVGVVLLAVAGVLALVGKKQTDQVSALPQRAIQTTREDPAAIKEARRG